MRKARSTIARMLTVATLGCTAVSILSASAAHADVDTDFTNRLHTYGVYGPKDYNAWLAKIACKRMATRLDPTASESAAFLFDNLDGTNSTEQAWQFLGLAVTTYCPEQTSALQSAAGLIGPTSRRPE